MSIQQGFRQSRRFGFAFAGAVTLFGIASTADAAYLDQFNTNTVGNSAIWLQGANGSPSSAVLSWDAAAGVKDQAGNTALGGGVNLISAGDTSAIYQGQTYDFSTGASHTVSVDFFHAVTNSGPTMAQLGFVNGNTRSFNGTAPYSFVSTRIRDGGSNTATIEGQRAANGSTATAGTTSGFSLADGNWYRISATFTQTNTTTGLFSFLTTVSDLGVDGTSTPSLVSSSSGTLAVSSLAGTNSSGLYAGFRTSQGTPFSATKFDNFAVDTAVIPEPASIGLIGLAVTAGVLRRRRRHT